MASKTEIAKKALDKALNYWSGQKLTNTELNAIAENASCSRLYAENVLQKRFEKGEKSIATSAKQSYLYAKDVIYGRFSLGEDAILKSPKFAFLYIEDVLRGAWPEAEEIISKDAEYSYLYANRVLNARFPKGEDAILQDAHWAFYYAKDVIEDRWTDAEKIISKDAKTAYEYAESFDLNRFEEAEETFSKDAVYAVKYAIEITKERFEQAEKLILENIGNWAIFDYVEKSLKGRWEALEKKINQENDLDALCSYATALSNAGVKPPEEIHNRLLAESMTDNYTTEDYFESLKDLEKKRKIALVSNISVEQLENILKNAGVKI